MRSITRLCGLCAATAALCGAAFAQENAGTNLYKTQEYHGLTGKKAVIFYLNWPAPGKGSKVTGDYFFLDDAMSTSYSLSGKNYKDGRLVLTEYREDKPTAVIRLRKSVKDGGIHWNGTMYNTDGRKIPVSLTSYSEAQNE